MSREKNKVEPTPRQMQILQFLARIQYRQKGDVIASITTIIEALDKQGFNPGTSSISNQLSTMKKHGWVKMGPRAVTALDKPVDLDLSYNVRSTWSPTQKGIALAKPKSS